MAKQLVNRVKKSGLITLDLNKLLPVIEAASLDIGEFLDEDLIFRERPYRQAVKAFDWSQYQGQILCIENESGGIIPHWAFMLIVKHAGAYTADIYQGSLESYKKMRYRQVLNEHHWKDYTDAKMVVKGCGGELLPSDIYAYALQKLIPYASSIMYGEACSAVPIFKNKKLKDLK